MAMKKCKDCGLTKPLSEFARDRTRVDGHRYECKPCSVLRTSDWRSRNAERAAEYQRAYLRARPELVRERNQRQRAKYGDRIKAQQREYYWRNRERRVTYNREWYHRTKDSRREAERQRLRERYWANRDAYRERYREAYLTDPQKFWRWEAARRARKLSAVGYASETALRARWDYFAGKCWMCGKDATGWDHLIPLARGGSNWPANLRPACKSCNSRKSTKLPREMVS